MGKTSLYFCLLAAALLLSCSPSGTPDFVRPGQDIEAVKDKKNDPAEALAPREYVQWVQDPQNGLQKEKTIEDIVYSVQYKPADYVICMEERSDTLSTQTLESRRKELEGMIYFDLKISAPGHSGELLKYDLPSAYAYEKRVNYLAFAMQQDIKLACSGIEIPCGLYHFERAFDAAPYARVLLGFAAKPQPRQEAVISFHDKLFGKGIIKFTFTTDEMNTIPKIKTL